MMKLLSEWKSRYDALNEKSTEEERDYVDYLAEQICLVLTFDYSHLLK